MLADAAEARAEQELQGWRERGIQAIGFDDGRYPRRLTDVTERPALLFGRGTPAEADKDGVAVIGTRRPTPAGVQTAQALAEALVRAGRTVISGLAAGIDTAAHEAALRAGGRTIAVLGNGLDHVYPAANAGLQGTVHVALSQFWPEQAPSRKTFPLRNAVMSGISAATVIVEAGERSGARIQARHALAQGRRLFLMRPLLREEWARTLAPQAGVRVINSADELIEALAAWMD